MSCCTLWFVVIVLNSYLILLILQFCLVSLANFKSTISIFFTEISFVVDPAVPNIKYRREEMVS